MDDKQHSSTQSNYFLVLFLSVLDMCIKLIMIIMQASASEDEASDDSSSTVEDEDKEFSANEEDGKCDFHIALFALSSKCIS